MIISRIKKVSRTKVEPDVNNNPKNKIKYLI